MIILKAMSFALIGVDQLAGRFRGVLLTLRYVTEPLPGERLDLIVANVLAWMVAVSGSYVMNSYVTFAAESGRKLRWKHSWRSRSRAFPASSATPRRS